MDGEFSEGDCEDVEYAIGCYKLLTEIRRGRDWPGVLDELLLEDPIRIWE